MARIFSRNARCNTDQVPTYPKSRPYGADVDGEDVPVRDRPYEHFGSQGYAMPDHVADEDASRGAVRVELGEPVAEPVQPAALHVDERIRAEICERLARDVALAAGDLEVVVHHGEVAVSGTVSEEALRDRAVRIASSTRGVVDVVDRIRVR